MMNLMPLVDKLKTSRHVIISAHINPDGDAIGAMVGMGHLCEQLGVPYVILLEAYSKTFSYLLDNIHWATEANEVDTFVTVDCGGTDRLVGYEKYKLQAKTIINIDHHITNTQYGHLNYVIPEASSTCELIYRLIEETGVAVTTKMAEAIYTGLVTDTGGFMHSNVAPSTHVVASKLIQHDFDFSRLYHKLIHEHSLATVKLQAKAIQNLIKVNDSGMYLSFLDEEDFETAQARKEDVEGVVHYLKNIEGVQVIALLYCRNKEESLYKLSMRSNKPYDVAEVCKRFGGGGHALAAGATLVGELNQLVSQMREVMVALNVG